MDEPFDSSRLAGLCNHPGTVHMDIMVLKVPVERKSDLGGKVIQESEVKN